MKKHKNTIVRRPLIGMAVLMLTVFMVSGCSSKKTKVVTTSQSATTAQAEVSNTAQSVTLKQVKIGSSSQPVVAEEHMVSTANPFASEAALQILRDGGSAIDAAIAAQLVLTLVEPQSSGIGGGAFMMYYDAVAGDIAAYDGRETAPASATPDMFLEEDGKPMGFYDAVVGGTSVGVPGVLRMLEMAHQEYGKLPWEALFESAIVLARDGFPVSPRMSTMIAGDEHLKTFEETASYFFDENGDVLQVGAILKNAQLADTLTEISKEGAVAFYNGSIAEDIASRVQSAERHPGGMTVSDLSGYKAVKRAPSCMPYGDYLVCGMPPPSSGGITTLQMLGILQNFDMASLKPGSVESVHLVAEAGRLSFADRNTYLADPDFVMPPPGMTDPGYLKLRASEISLEKAMGKALPGMPGLGASNKLSPDSVEKGLSTTHFSIVDSSGNAVSMTSSIENKFGSRMMVRGFLLNNQLTDFSFVAQRNGVPVANQVEPNKRPRSSMAPTLVFDMNGDVVLAVGSPGGSSIIGYVAKTLIANLDWGMNIQQAIELPHFMNKNGKTYLEGDTPLALLKPALDQMGHDVQIRDFTSGLHAIARDGNILLGGADPRREGVAVGD
ncbi:MAG: gamma-glutamyltransferase [Rhodospirillales bacterium]|jgi:gamma-glutamyltranspeptidase / glutathione hydrolase|nr:gamma-glutamyltransferase [Rhodospirillales bacterium]